MSEPVLSIIVAVARNGVIGSAGQMPWRLSTDLKRFKALTMGKPVVMGRKTYQSIGRALPGRTNIVVTRDPAFSAENVLVAASLEAAIDMARERAHRDASDEFFVIGGGTIYAETLPLADRLHVTHVEAEPDGDTSFPPIATEDWAMLEETPVLAGDRDNVPTRYAVYARRNR